MKITDIIKRILTAIAGLFGFRSIMNPLPLFDLKNENGIWISIGKDPAFILEGKFYCGWNIISWNSISSVDAPVKLYWDDGSGFSESKSTSLASISAGQNKYKAVFYIPINTIKLRLDPGDREFEFKMEKIMIKKTMKRYLALQSILNIVKQRGFSLGTIKMLFHKALNVYRTQGIEGVKQKIKIVQDNKFDENYSYQIWLSRNAITSTVTQEANKVMRDFKYNPLISVILPVYNVDEVWLRKCIDSVMGQIYTKWELCISDDASPKMHIKNVLKEYEEQDARIKVVYRSTNGHISENSNSALEIATGEFIALLDHDDELASTALFEVVKLLNTYPEADMIYTDEDKIGVNGERHSPYFKPDWSPDLILSNMYTCHLGIYRKEIVDQLGGFRKGYEGSQDYDLVLRFTELTNRIHHLPKILYHWRSIPESTASGSGAKNYTHYAGIRSLEDALKRREIDGKVQEIDGYPNMYRIHYNLSEEPLVSIIIPTKDGSEILDLCLKSIVSKTNYSKYEIIIVDNGSKQEETFAVFRDWELRLNGRLRIITLDIPFNYSKINNVAAQASKGSLILLLNNDIEIISSNWLEEMVGYALRANTGAVGAKLYYPDRTIQHSGVIMGLGGIAGHAFRTCNELDPGYFGMLLTNRNCSVVTAACLMVRKEVFNEVGGLEEDLAVAFNDVDFCLKLIDKGYYNVCLNNVSLYHHESKTRGAEDTTEKKARFMQEIEYMLEKWPELIKADPFYNINLSLESDKSYLLKI
ncbi:glycosyltransferase family 2 protein [Paenibacillus sp. FSL R10-2736]|uniref:glycosyltransferase family 2 protein n=1 Tax=Paenibacillus sp. FSL R10-2736 TaxID=2954692 RepID=UPI0030F91E89